MLLKDLISFVVFLLNQSTGSSKLRLIDLWNERIIFEISIWWNEL